MIIEFDYTSRNTARMTFDDEALKMILNYIVYDIRDLAEAEIIEVAQCVGAIAQAIAKLEAEKKAEEEAEKAAQEATE